MTADRLINILVTITLVEMMGAIGLGVKFTDLGGLVGNRTLLVRGAIANYVCVRVITLVLLLWLRSPAIVATGFLIVAVCPGAAYGPPLTAMARGNVTLAVGLMVILAGSSVIFAPVLLRLLLPLMAKSRTLKIDAVKMMKLFACQLLPLFAGLCVCQWRPTLADRLKQPADQACASLNLCILAIILFVHSQALASIRLIAFAEMSALVMASLAAGWLPGESGGDNRKAMAFSTSVRNVAVGLVIATAPFPARLR
jgi:bile acid:Na+ symporter, BASS family